MILGSICGIPGEIISGPLPHFLRVPFWLIFEATIDSQMGGAGGSAGAHGALKILQDLQQDSSTLCSPFGGAADILRLRPCRWPFFFERLVLG